MMTGYNINTHHPLEDDCTSKVQDRILIINFAYKCNLYGMSYTCSLAVLTL